MSTLTLLSDETQRNAERLAFFNTVRFVAHGYHIFRGRLAAGKSYTIDLPDDTTPEAVNMATVWTKGRITAPSNGVLPDRVPGMFSKGRTERYRKGEYKFVVAEDSEWWCISGFSDVVDLLTVTGGQSALLPTGTLGLVLGGVLSVGSTSIPAGTPFAIMDTDKTVTAGEDTAYAFIFERAYTP